MQYLLLVTKDTSVPASEADRSEAPDVEAWWHELNDAGRIVAGDPLEPAAQAVTVRVCDKKVLRTEGPFSEVSEVSEVIIGLDIIEADSMDDAVAAAAGHPLAWAYAIEVRAFTPLD